MRRLSSINIPVRCASTQANASIDNAHDDEKNRLRGAEADGQLWRLGYDPEFDHPPRSARPPAHALAARPPHAVSFSGRQTGDRDDDHTDRRGMTLYRRLTGSSERRPRLGTRVACLGAHAPGKPARTTARTGSGGNKVVRPCRAAE